jgi:HKD family nuclease
MLITPLSQGITTDISNSTGEALIRLLNDSDYHTFTGMSAFATVSGVNGLAPHIEAAKQRGMAINFVVGVDQKATSKEALEAIVGLGINSFVYHQLGGSIFHPKIYLFEGEHKSQLIVGSSNLTKWGLYENIEASLLLEFSNDDSADLKVLNDMKASFSSLYDFSDPNLSTITPELIERLVVEKVVPTAAQLKQNRANLDELDKETQEPTERLLLEWFPKRKRPRAPAAFTGKKAVKRSAGSEKEEEEIEQEEYQDEIDDDTVEVDQYALVWEMRNTPGSSVQTTNRPTTKATGMLRLVQAEYRVGGIPIKQATYFREVVFGNLPWLPITDKTDIAIAKFDIVIRGQNHGQHSLKIRYKPDGAANQDNYTTGISWGTDLGRVIKDAQLVGRTVRLYSLIGSNDTFRLEFI